MNPVKIPEVAGGQHQSNKKKRPVLLGASPISTAAHSGILGPRSPNVRPYTEDSAWRWGEAEKSALRPFGSRDLRSDLVFPDEDLTVQS